MLDLKLSSFEPQKKYKHTTLQKLADLESTSEEGLIGDQTHLNLSTSSFDIQYVNVSNEVVTANVMNVKHAFLAVRRTFSTLQSLNNKLALYFSVNIGSHRRSIEKLLSDFQKKTLTEDQKVNIQELKFTGYSYSDFVAKMNAINSLCDALIKQHDARKEEQPPQFGYAELRELGYILTGDYRLQKVQSTAPAYTEYEFFKQNTMNDLIYLTEQYLQLCEKVDRFRDLPGHNESQISGSMNQIAQVDDILAKLRPDAKEKVQSIVSNTNRELMISTHLTNGSTIIKQQMELMNSMLTDVWENIINITK